MPKDQPTEMTLRERFVIVLVVFLIQMVKPWEYEHQFKKFWDEIKELISPPKQ